MRSLARLTLDKETASRWREYWHSREAWLKAKGWFAAVGTDRTVVKRKGGMVWVFYLTNTPDGIDAVIGYPGDATVR